MTAMSTPRLAPGRRTVLGLINNTLCLLAGGAMGGKRPSVFTTLGCQHGLFRAWLWYSSKMMPAGKLPRRVTEPVILRIATNRRCDYENGHHVRIGRRVGVTTEEPDNIGNAPTGRAGLPESGRSSPPSTNWVGTRTLQTAPGPNSVNI